MKILKGGEHNIVINLENEYDALGNFYGFDGSIMNDNDQINITYKTYNINNKIDIFFKVSREVSNNFLGAEIDWGDGMVETLNHLVDLYHFYPFVGEFHVNILIKTSFGDFLYTNKVPIPSHIPNGVFHQINLSNGVVYQHEPNNEFDHYEADVDIYFVGYGASRIEEKSTYGGGYFGVTEGVYNNGVTWKRYEIDNLQYEDTSDGLTTITGNTRDFANETYLDFKLTRIEHFLGFVEEPKIFSDVYLDRGKQSVIEKSLRLCEIDNVGELTVYGNNYFKIKK